MNAHTHPMATWEVIAAVLLFIILVGTYRLVKGILKAAEKDLIFDLVWRWVSGAHLHGRQVTDATWWSHGTTTDRKYNKDGFISRWEHKPRGHRALWRLGCTMGFIGVIYGLISDWTVTLNAIKSFGVYLVVVVAFLIEERWVLRVHNRRVINPIVKSLAPVLRLSPHSTRRLLHISPENISDEGEVGYFEFPPEITPSDDMKTTMERVINAHLPVDIELDLKLQQAPRIGEIIAGLKPPSDVPWDSMLEAMANCPVGDVILGMERYKNPYSATFTGLDDPHWGMSVQTGSGKSNFLAIVAAQILHQNPQATCSVIDPKRVSLIDFLGSPNPGIGLKPLIKGVRMANNPLRPEDMRAVISDTRALMERRALKAERDRTLKFDIHLLIIDELNMFTDIMLSFYRHELSDNKVARAQDKTIPEMSKDDPMWDDIRAILRMGRFTNVHMLVVSQDLRDDAFGGKGARNYLGFRGLGNYNKKQWDMLVGTSPYPVPQKGIGRWNFVNSGDQTWVQITHGDEEKVYEYASYGRELHDAHVALAQDVLSVPDTHGVCSSASLNSELTDGLQNLSDSSAMNIYHLEPMAAPEVIAQSPPAITYGLSGGAAYLGMTVAAFEKARARMPDRRIPGEFRQGRQPAWYTDDLDTWKRNRPGNKEDQ